MTPKEKAIDLVRKVNALLPHGTPTQTPVDIATMIADELITAADTNNGEAYYERVKTEIKKL